MRALTPYLSGAAAAALVLLAACGGDPERPIDPVDDPDRLSRNLNDVQLGGVSAVREAGDLPAATTDPDTPQFLLGVTVKVSERGQRVSFPFSVDAPNALNTLFAKVVGAPDVFTAVLSGSTKATSDLSLGFDLPGNLRDGVFCIDLAVVDDSGLTGVSGQSLCVDVGGVGVNPTPTPTAAPTPTPTAAPTPQPTVTGATGVTGSGG